VHNAAQRQVRQGSLYRISPRAYAAICVWGLLPACVRLPDAEEIRRADCSQRVCTMAFHRSCAGARKPRARKGRSGRRPRSACAPLALSERAGPVESATRRRQPRWRRASSSVIWCTTGRERRQFGLRSSRHAPASLVTQWFGRPRSARRTRASYARWGSNSSGHRVASLPGPYTWQPVGHSWVPLR
jgi:hypothetical protein